MPPTPESSLQTWIDWLLALHATEIDLGLDRVSQVAERLNLLSSNAYVISVAGTNGKGSSVATLSAIYRAAGYQVGCYTSPHILRFNERYQINQTPVVDQVIVDAFVEIELARGDTKLTYFEFSTLAALVIFAKMPLDVLILEVGLGGRLDAVNIIDADASLITPIDVDHSDWLGSDREVIGFEKSGIMRSGQLSVCSDMNPPNSIAKHAKKLGIKLWQAGKDFQAISLANQQWDLQSNQTSIPPLKALPNPSLKGLFQCQNSAGVVALIQLIAKSTALPVSREDIEKGLQSIQHPGRLQSLLLNNQNWLVDVAHNPQSAGVLADYLAEINFKGEAVFSVLADKDYQAMVEKMAPYIRCWHIADLNIPRNSSLSRLKTMLLDAGVAEEAIQSYDSVALATQRMLKTSVQSVLVWGSFFTVSQSYQALIEQGMLIEGMEK